MNQLEGYCKECGYPLHGLPSGACPECGCAFNWSIPSTSNRGNEPVQSESDAVEEYRRALGKRISVFALLLIVGLFPLASVDNLPGYAWCCLMIFALPVWLMLCVIAVLSIVSSTGSLGVPGALLIGLGVGITLGFIISLIATSFGTVGLIFGLPAGLLGALIFKQLELNNML